MKNDILFDKLNGIDDKGYLDKAQVLKMLKLIEQRLESEAATRQNVIEWQLTELKRLQLEIVEKDKVINDLGGKLSECRSHVEGNRQLVNKLIGDIDRLHQDIEWYKRTYETRSLLGIIKDKLKHFFSK